MKELVSVLTPCYNGEKYVNRLLNSVLTQTYEKIEMIVINDGSTDSSLSIINSYIPKFEKRGYSLQCFTQKNQGQGMAINNGLKYVKGEFLVWPDSDDFYASSDTIATLVSKLNKHPDVSMVRCFANTLHEDTLEKIGVFGNNWGYSENLFEECMFAKKNFWFLAGGYMLRMQELEKHYPTRDIYPSNKFGGQNFQLMLPVLYNNRCITIQEPLYNVLVRANSHSRGQFKSKEELIKRNDEVKRILYKTLESIDGLPKSEHHRLLRKINKIWTRKLSIQLLFNGNFFGGGKYFIRSLFNV